MNEGDLRRRPSPELAALVYDHYGSHFTRERWGLKPDTLWRLVTEGRRRTGRYPAPGGLHEIGPHAHHLLDPRWDGRDRTDLTLTPASAAAALGLLRRAIGHL